MTTCGYFWTIVVIAAAVVAVTISAVRGEKSGGTPSTAKAVPLPQTRQAAGDGKRTGAEPGPRAFRRGGARYVCCQASTRLDDGYIVSLGGRSGDNSEKMLTYAKKELAAVLAEQALYKGAIEFTQVGGELRACMRTVTGEIGTPLPGERSFAGAQDDRERSAQRALRMTKRGDEL